MVHSNPYCLYRTVIADVLSALLIVQTIYFTILSSISSLNAIVSCTTIKVCICMVVIQIQP